MNRVEFVVYGVPVAKGNLSAFPFRRKNGAMAAAVTDTTKGLGQWQALVRHEAQQHADGTCIEGPVRVHLEFRLPRPVSLPKRFVECTKKPDIDKLARAILDAITGPVVKDDAQVISLYASKGYIPADLAPYVLVLVEEVPPVFHVEPKQPNAAGPLLPI